LIVGSCLTTYFKIQLKESGLSVVGNNLLGMENENGLSGFTALETSAIKLNEIYRVFLKAGFESEEALDLIVKIMKK
jgi:hypothetical protein